MARGRIGTAHVSYKGRLSAAAWMTFVVVAMTGWGCAGHNAARAQGRNEQNETTLRRRAAFDMGCSETEIELVPLQTRGDARHVPREEQYGNHLNVLQYGASGCGRRAVYVNSSSGWVLNAESGSGSESP